MKIGIDISQLAYSNTGVANYLSHLVCEMIAQDTDNEYVLFFSSLRGTLSQEFIQAVKGKAEIKKFKFPPSALDLVWNRLHIMPIENLIGNVDVFISSDWSQPPTKKARSATIIYDMIVYKYPEETHDQTTFNISKFQIKPNIVQTQKRRLKWVAKECNAVLCISESTKRDVQELLGVEKKRLHVIYPGLTLNGYGDEAGIVNG